MSPRYSPVRQGIGSASPSPLAPVYQALVARWQSNNTILWQLFAFTIAAQVALAVGIAGLKNDGVWNFVLGCIGLGGLGVFAPLAVRFIETLLLTDRLLMDHYEVAMLKSQGEDLRLLHGVRMRSRISYLYSALSPDERGTLGTRRLTKLGKFGSKLDNLLDKLGQPSLIWTMAVAGSGCIGFDFGFKAWKQTDLLHGYVQYPIMGLHNALLLAIAALAFAGGGEARSYWANYIEHNALPSARGTPISSK